MRRMLSPAHPSLRTPVPDGLRAHRDRVRRWGLLVGLAVPAVMGGFGALLLRGSETPWRGIPGFALAVMAVPTLPLSGIPAAAGTWRWVLAIGSSLLLWSVVGVVATRRALTRVATGWPEWRREWLPLAIGVWLGALAALGIAGVAMSLDLV